MSGGHNTAVRRASKGFWDAMSLAAKREDIAKGKMSAAYWANKEKW